MRGMMDWATAAVWFAAMTAAAWRMRKCEVVLRLENGRLRAEWRLLGGLIVLRTVTEVVREEGKLRLRTMMHGRELPMGKKGKRQAGSGAFETLKRVKLRVRKLHVRVKVGDWGDAAVEALASGVLVAIMNGLGIWVMEKNGEKRRKKTDLALKVMRGGRGMGEIYGEMVVEMGSAAAAAAAVKYALASV